MAVLSCAGPGCQRSFGVVIPGEPRGARGSGGIRHAVSRLPDVQAHVLRSVPWPSSGENARGHVPACKGDLFDPAAARGGPVSAAPVQSALPPLRRARWGRARDRDRSPQTDSSRDRRSPGVVQQRPARRTAPTAASCARTSRWCSSRASRDPRSRRRAPLAGAGLGREEGGLGEAGDEPLRANKINYESRSFGYPYCEMCNRHVAGARATSTTRALDRREEREGLHLPHLLRPRRRRASGSSRSTCRPRHVRLLDHARICPGQGLHGRPIALGSGSPSRCSGWSSAVAAAPSAWSRAGRATTSRGAREDARLADVLLSGQPSLTYYWDARISTPSSSTAEVRDGVRRAESGGGGEHRRRSGEVTVATTPLQHLERSRPNGRGRRPRAT